MYLSETGGARYLTGSLHGDDQGENENAQADATKNILEDVFEFQRVCSGVTLFAFVDEWWKAGNNETQDPDDEEYWGIVDIDRNKKEAYEVVKKKYNSVH